MCRTRNEKQTDRAAREAQTADSAMCWTMGYPNHDLPAQTNVRPLDPTELALAGALRYVCEARIRWSRNEQPPQGHRSSSDSARRYGPGSCSP